MLDPFEQRTDPSLSAFAIAGSLNQKFQALYGEGFTAVFPPPPVAGLGNTGGFKLQVQDREGQGYVALNQALQALMAEAAKDGRITGLFSAYSVGVPQANIEVDREKAKTLGVPLQSVYDALQVNLGSLYVNDVNLMGRAGGGVYGWACARHALHLIDGGGGVKATGASLSCSGHTQKAPALLPAPLCVSPISTIICAADCSTFASITKRRAT